MFHKVCLTNNHAVWDQIKMCITGCRFADIRFHHVIIDGCWVLLWSVCLLFLKISSFVCLFVCLSGLVIGDLCVKITDPHWKFCFFRHHWYDHEVNLNKYVNIYFLKKHSHQQCIGKDANK